MSADEHVKAQLTPEGSKRVVWAVVMGGCQSYVSTQRYVDT
jgi:hypothetical protein